MAANAGNRDVLVFAEKAPLLAELLAAARSLVSGGQVTAVVLGPREEAEQALKRGADRVMWLGQPADNALVDDYVPTLAGILDEGRPYALLIGSTKVGRAIAGRLAGRLNVTALTDVQEFIQDGGSLQARHLIFGGGAVRVDKPLGEPIIATISPGTFDPLPERASDSARGANVEIMDVPMIAPVVKVKLRERKVRQAAKVNLAVAKKIVCAGRGLAKQEDLNMVNELARLLGAEVACSRPLAEGLDWLPRERYIGISGATVRPDLYLGVGVSGQAQHAIGMNESRVVVAINKDQNAPIFTQADYAIAEDLYQVVPALIQALKSRR